MTSHTPYVICRVTDEGSSHVNVLTSPVTYAKILAQSLRCCLTQTQLVRREEPVPSERKTHSGKCYWCVFQLQAPSPHICQDGSACLTGQLVSYLEDITDDLIIIKFKAVIFFGLPLAD